MNPYGCEVTVAIRTGVIATEEKTFHWRGSESACRRKAMLKIGAVHVVKVVPLDERQYISAYGLNQRM